ncbi:calcium-binding protein [Oceaniglobus trochenteri]|uniref:calcium-binding protein n=1 Tax=Oceaniglobus trochenteri TaxID=2763260 RepID=UPI001CFF80EC|nr:calcium-binding protein [Oceaniglobus trochenteri]
MAEIVSDNGSFRIFSSFGFSVQEGSLRGSREGPGRGLSFMVEQIDPVFRSAYVRIEGITGSATDFWDTFWSNEIGGEPANQFALSGFVSFEDPTPFRATLNADDAIEKNEFFRFSVYEKVTDPGFGVAPLISADFTVIDDDGIMMSGERSNDVLRGRDEAIAINGMEGNDDLTGGSLNDTIDGGVGDDRIDGGGGADLLIGGPGSDRFIVDNVEDRVIESRNWAGTDTVASNVDFRMGNRHIENLELTGEARLGAGNGLRNLITGNDGDNILDGGRNVDTLVGGLGNDRYLLRAPGDNAVEEANGGIDTVLAFRSVALDDHVENLYIQTLRNAAGEGVAGVNGIGNDLDNTIVGNPFDNFITGRGGRDTLKGQAGADTFVFDRTPGPGNVDRIIDFNTNEADEGDRLLMKGAVFGDMAAGGLDPALFRSGTAAMDADDRFIFDRPSGQLWFDADGTGGAVQKLIATFAQDADLSAEDIFLF